MATGTFHEALRVGEHETPGALQLIALTGSRAHGTSRPDSDYDFKGFYVAPMERVLSIFKKTEQVVDRKDPDIVFYELGHLARLAANANPTVLEILWSEPLWSRPIAEMLRMERGVFLGARRVRDAFGGYAVAQLRKAKAETGGSRGATHHQRLKFRLHTLRLAEAGCRVLRTGEVPVAVEDPERLWADAARDLDWLEARVSELLAEMDDLVSTTSLPENPDTEAIDRLVYRLRFPPSGYREVWPGQMRPRDRQPLAGEDAT